MLRKNVFGPIFVVLTTIGSAIGVGILRIPHESAEALQDLKWFWAAWLFGAVYSLFGAFAVSELAARDPQSGGFYNFAKSTFGPFIGFVVGWMDWLVISSAIAAMTIALVQFLGEIFGITRWEGLLASVLIVLFALIQWRGVRWSEKAQEFLTWPKVLAFAFIVGTFFIFGDRASLPQPASSPTLLPEGFALGAGLIKAMQGILPSYGGWEAAIYVGEEVRDPAKTIPRTVIWGTVLVDIVFLGMVGAVVHAVGFEGLKGSKVPYVLAAESIFGQNGRMLMNVLAVCIIASAISACCINGPRVLYKISTDGLFAAGAQRVNQGGTPSAALWITAVAAIAFAATGTFGSVLAILANFQVANYALAFLEVFVLRRRHTEPPPYSAWGHPWTTGGVLLASVAFLVGASLMDPKTAAINAGLVLFAYPAFRVTRRVCGEKER
ncbi:MAG: APC family permease [Oligoflexia bacterium]|nr:APC family permease [Oligoflexia bacterium]